MKVNTKKNPTYKSLTPAQKAWITIRAKQEGKDPKMVHAGIKALYTRKNQDHLTWVTVRALMTKKSMTMAQAGVKAWWRRVENGN